MQTNSLVEQLNQQGFVLIKRVLKPSAIAKLQHFCDELVAQAQSHYVAGLPFDNIAIMQAENESFVYRVNELFQFQPQFAQLLAQNELMSYVEAIIGEAVLPSYESLVIKNSLDVRGFDWHRDMAVRTQEPIFTVGVYLDDAIAQQGALSIIPQSHCSQASVCDLKRQLSNAQVQCVDVTANAGDVVIHHVNTVHASGRQEGLAIRRTIYFEFRAVSHFIDNPSFCSEWIEKRQALMAHLNTLKSDQMVNSLQLPKDFYVTQIQIEPAEYCLEFAN